MSCNCKVNRNLAYLQKNYGVKRDVSLKEETTFGILEFFRRFITIIATILSIPVMFIFLVIKLFSKKKEIDLTKILRLKQI